MISLLRNLCYAIAAVALLVGVCYHRYRISPDNSLQHKGVLIVITMYVVCVVFVVIGFVINSYRTMRPKYHNIEPTIQFTGTKHGFPKTAKGDIRIPSERVDAEVVDLNSCAISDDYLVWMGHSSIYIQLNGRTFLVDPVLCSSFPSNIMMKAFPGSDIWKPDDIPAVDYLIITHDHYDHLDKKTLRKIRDRVGQVYCGLDVGDIIKSCGYKAEQIHEMTWDDSVCLDDGIKLHCLTSRHFSGRFLKPNPTLWTSWMLLSDKTIFISGDGGYGKHFKEIGERFNNIDLAIMENGQYSPNWKHIHMLPEELPQAIEDLKAKKVFTYHHGKFALSHHDWREPEHKIKEASEGATWKLLDTIIGNVVKF